MEISKQEFEAITKLVPEKRYDYFIKRICDWEQVWTLYNDDCIILNEDKKGDLFILLFPFEPFASYYAIKTEGMQNAVCKSYSIKDFFGSFLEKLLSNNITKALVFPIPNGFGLNVPIKTIKEDVNEELENYE